MSIYAADVDGDGDQDVVTGAFWEVVWFENTDGRGRFGDRQVITEDVQAVQSLFAADIDGDGDLDVLSASGNDGKTAWYENTSGQGSFGPQNVIAAAELSAPRDVFATDLDGDGDADVLSVSLRDEEFIWYETSSAQAGDANRDWRFDQLDIVQVLQSAKFLADEPATWEEGDWNGDGRFDQRDVTAALQTGGYLQGSYAADLLFASISGPLHDVIR